MKTCSVTCAGTRGRSMTSRVRWVQPPDNGGSAIGAALHRVLHPVGGGHPSTGKAMGSGLPGLLGGRRFRAGPGLEAGHPRWAARFGFVLQLGDAPFQAANDRLLLDDEGDELVAAGGVQVDAGIHVISMTYLPRSALAPTNTTFSQSTSPTLNSYRLRPTLGRQRTLCRILSLPAHKRHRSHACRRTVGFTPGRIELCLWIAFGRERSLLGRRYSRSVFRQREKGRSQR